MKTFICAFIAVVGLTFSASAQTPKGTSTKTPTKEMELPAKEVALVNLSGTYTSKKGVMDKISCFGYNVGYLQTSEKMPVVICFDRMTNGSNIKITCEGPLKVEGYYESVTKESNEACKGGTMNIFYVTKWACD
jgi:hypothetical protein